MDGTETEPAGQRHPYRQLVEEVQEVVLQATPPGAVVAVVSRGDPELLRFEERVGWHFPQTDEGVYAGCYPAESEEAIAQLEALRAKGATHLVFPSTASWWLEHYGGLREHVDAHCQRVWADERCTIYRVTEAVTAPLDGRRSTSWERVRRLFVRSAAS